MSLCSIEMETEDWDLNEGDLVYINVCGMLYVTLKSTLERYPSTLLGNEERRNKHFVSSKNAYFFDRHRQCFEAVLYYYQSKGTLNRPPNIPFGLFVEEISFFGLGKDVLLELQEKEGFLPGEVNLPEICWQRKIWETFEDPASSIAAKVLSCWSIFVIIVSIIIFCIETMPRFRRVADEDIEVANASQSHVQPWFSLELGCFTWFTIEYALRLISSPDKWKFAKSFLNVIDILAIFPFFITLILNSKILIPLPVLRVVWLVRVFRIFKLSRHSKRLQILGHTLKASIRELCMLIFFLLTGIILFSSALFWVERGQNEAQFKSIPDAFWYSLVTMTTVGYGDKAPSTLGGKLIGSLCAVSGVLAIALPVPVIVSNFEFFYQRDRVNHDQEKMSIPRMRCSLSDSENTVKTLENGASDV